MLEYLTIASIGLFLFNFTPNKQNVSYEDIKSKNPRVITEMSSNVKIIKKEQKKNYKDLTVYITYYTNFDDLLQGGQNDRRGVPLKSHGEKIIAMPQDVPYGSYIDIEDMGKFKVVDTGGAIVWLDENTCKVDIFVPDVDYQWLCNNTVKEIKQAKLYINE
ncbi:hypothetical protein JCM1393_28630 [Clostridium carnis]